MISPAIYTLPPHGFKWGCFFRGSLGVSKRTVERLVQTAANLTPEAKRIIHDADEKITKGAALKISRLPPDQQEEAAMRLTTSPPPPKKQSVMDTGTVLREFITPAIK